jgi:prevent-host-death family protein
MRTAAISKLKASLSGYIEVVKGGEEVVVTDHGKAVARIVPVLSDPSALSDRWKKLESAGLLRIGSGKVPRGFWSARRPADPGGKAVRAILEERSIGR